MKIKDLQDLYNYDARASRKLFDVIARLTPEQFTQPVAGGYGSIRNTLVHTMSTEWGWLDRGGGEHRGAALKGENFPTFECLTQAGSINKVRFAVPN